LVPYSFLLSSSKGILKRKSEKKLKKKEKKGKVKSNKNLELIVKH